MDIYKHDLKPTKKLIFFWCCGLKFKGNRSRVMSLECRNLFMAEKVCIEQYNVVCIIFIMAESKLSSIQEGNLCEIINDRINWYLQLIAFFVTYEVSSRGAICLLIFLSPFFKISYSKVKKQVNCSGNNLWCTFFILKPLGVYV